MPFQKPMDVSKKMKALLSVVFILLMEKVIFFEIPKFAFYFENVAWTVAMKCCMSSIHEKYILGVLRQITINDLPVGRSVEETLRLVQAFQFVDEHGEVCPAGWKPGKDTMKADPKGSKEYFSKQ